jgi:hypothetical protein
MGSIAKGKVNASEAQAGMRIIVKVSEDGTVRPSSTKTGEGVQVARITDKTYGMVEQGWGRVGRRYMIETTAGSFEAAPIQTMWLAPEDPAGIKRAMAEALAEDAHRAELAAVETVPAVEAGAAPAAPLALTETQIEENAAEVEILSLAAAEAARDENEAPGGIYHGTAWASTSPALQTQMIGRVLRRPELTFDLPKVPTELISLEGLTLHSQACNVLSISSEHGEPEEIEMAQNLTHDEARNYPLSTGEIADLIALVSSVKPSDWVQATEVQPVGTVVYAYAMGELRQGVVVKNTPTKTLVALTTAAAAAPGGSVRIQTATELHTTVYVAPAPAAEPEPVEFTEAEREELAEDFKTSGALDDAHAEAEAEAEDRERAAAGETPIEADQRHQDEAAQAPETSQPEDLTLNSHAGKVIHMNNDASTEAPAATVRETTGSAVVRMMERVHARIRQNHPEVPAVVIVTGAGIGAGSNKWGHFRPQGWMAKSDDQTTSIHEMFMAGETLAKGARQVLQTMLHESAHAVAETRGVQDTSRQGRWHNKLFLATAREMGLEYRKPQANPQIGYSEVVLTDETVDEYSDLLDALETEIHLMVRLPGWLGGQDDNGESNGGEGMGQAPKGPAAPNTNNIKCVCQCEEPNIIRMSRKVLDQEVVSCEDCDSLFRAA